MLRSPDLRRSLVFVAGADTDAHDETIRARPDILAQDLEDFTPPQLKESARQLSASLFDRARQSGIIPAVRVNRLDDGGIADLAAIIPAFPALIMLPKAEQGDQIEALEKEIARLETVHGLPAGEIEIVPTVETALGLVNLKEIVLASARVKSCVLGAEDLAADLMAIRSPAGEELAYARSRFLLECRALRVEPIDPPYTFADAEGCEREARRSHQLGYQSKSTVTPAHVEIIHRILTPSVDDIASAERLVAAFEAGRERGEDRVVVDGLWVEPPAYMNARKLLDRARQLGVADGASRR